MTPVRGKRGSLVHAWMPDGSRRDLCPDDIPNIVCGKRLRGPLITDDNIDCPACLDIIFNGN